MPLTEKNTVRNEQDLLNFVFNNSSFGTDPGRLASLCIICPTNAEVDRINDLIIRGFFFGRRKIYQSINSVEENEHQYPLEFINSLCPFRMPCHNLTLKKKKHCHAGPHKRLLQWDQVHHPAPTSTCH